MPGGALIGLVTALSLGCTTSPAAPPRVEIDAAPGPPPTSPASIPAPGPTGGALAAETPAARSVPMYLAGEIASLFHLDLTDDGLELSLGSDGSGGVMGHYRYVPFVNGAPDFGRETSEASYVSTMGGGVTLVGRRPHLFMLAVGGFISPLTARYSILDEQNRWHPRDDLGKVEGLSYGISPWSKGRLLELVGPPFLERQRWTPLGERVKGTKPNLPRFRVVQGADNVPPSLPGALAKRLLGEGFDVVSHLILRTGEVLVVGGLAKGGGCGTLVWTDDEKEPEYFVSRDLDAYDGGFLGGTSLANVRLQSKSQVLRLERGREGSSWVVESTTAKDALPDVWFGSTLVMHDASYDWFARTTKGAPWLPVGRVHPGAKGDGVHVEYVADREGTIWGIEGEMLVSSRKIDKPVHVTEEDLVTVRKSSTRPP